MSLGNETEKFGIPVVTLIIERTKNGETELLVQTRHKPKQDAKYTGCLEIPGGKIRAFENVYDAVKREVLEETGLKVLKIKPGTKTVTHSPREDGSFAFTPFCCHQQVKGGEPWIGFAFICEVEDKLPKKEGDCTKDVHWMKKSELRKIFNENPEKIFTLQLGVLDFYFNHAKDGPLV